MASHTAFFFLYVTRKYVGLGEQMHRASKNTGSWMEWAFFVGDMERENIVVTMVWGDGGGIRLIYRICESFRCRAFYVAWTQEYMDKKKTKKKELQNKEKKKKT